MNLDAIFGLEESMPLVQANPIMLLSCIMSACLAGWFCVLKYRKTYEIEKSIRLYIPFAVGGAVIFSLAGIPVLFAVGAQLCGFVVLLLISNRCFRK